MKIYKVKAINFLKNAFIKETEDGKKKVKPVAAGGVVLILATVLNTLCAEYFGVSISIETFIQIINTLLY